MSQLSDKVVLITGGTSGIGAATAKLFRNEGATVIVTGSSEKSVQAAKDDMSGIDAIVSDAGDPAAAKALVYYVAGKHGRIDVLFVNAGLSRFAPITETEEEQFDLVFNVNFRGPYFLIKHAAPVLADGGSVILTSSIAADKGVAGLSAYGSSKAALKSLGRTLAVELAPRKIRVNTILPGFIDTPFGSKVGLSQQQMAAIGQMAGMALLGRAGQAEEIASAALYLAGAQSAFTTASELVIDGGLTAR